MTQPSSRAIVYGLDWYGAASPSGTGYGYADAGSFYIVTVPPVAVRPTDLEIKSASTVGVTVAPVFLVSLGEVGKLTVNFKTRVAGSFPVTLTFRGQPLNPPQGNYWMLYSHDASMTLTEYVPRFPPPGFSSWSLSDIKVGVQGNMLSFLKTDSGFDSLVSRRQWAGVGWDLPSLDIGQGLALVYRVRWNGISMGMKMNIPSLAMISDDESLVLRYDGRVFDWAIYDDRTKLSSHQSSSSIIADGMWHDIFVNISGSFLRVYEDGRNVLATARSCAILGAFDVVWEALGEHGGCFDADLMDFRSCPVAAHHDLPELVSRPTDLIFNLASNAANTKYFFVRSFNDSIAVTYADQGVYFCASNQLTQYVYNIYMHTSCVPSSSTNVAAEWDAVSAPTTSSRSAHTVSFNTASQSPAAAAKPK